MANPKLPGLNYSTPLGITDLEHLEAVYTDEFIRRMLAIAGYYREGGASFGIFSEYDPVAASDSSDPLFVEKNSIDGMTVNVHPGVALAENGMLIILTGVVESVEMVNQEVGQQNVVFIEYLTVDDEDTISKTRYDTSEARQLIRAPDTATDPLDTRILQVASFEDWGDDTLFTPERRKGIIALAFVTIASKSGTPGKEVSLDLSRTSLTTNRPWFSPVDIAHRSEKGTGSSDVPHNLGLNDLSQGSLTLYDQLLNHGMILGRDQDAPGVPGELCIETITPTQIQTDTTGSVTGTLSQRYVELSRYPVRLLGAYGVSDPLNEMLVEHLPHSNIVVIHHSETIPSLGFRVQYTTVNAGEPLADSLINDEIHFRQPVTSREMIVSMGKAFSELTPKFTDSFNNTRARISLGSAPAIPKRYRILVDETGQLIHTPQHILCSTKLDDIGDATFDFQIANLGAARVRVGLMGVTLSGSTIVRIRITGTDSQGSTITEDLTFDYSNYSLPSVGDCEQDQRNFQITDTVFLTIDSLNVLERTSDGPNTVVCVYADLDPLHTDAIRDACPLAEVMWNGEGVCRIQDIRPVGSRLAHTTRTSEIQAIAQAILASLRASGASGSRELLGEDLRDPHRLKLSDPNRFYKFSDGLRSSILPEQPLVEWSTSDRSQDIYTSHALPLIDVGTSGRNIHVTLLGHDAQAYLMNGQDGILPNVEYRVSLTADPETWTDWDVATPLSDGNGSNFIIPSLDSDAFKAQLRVKGSVVGITAIQYTQFGGAAQVYSGIRRVSVSGLGPSNTYKVVLPIGITLASSDYAININAFRDLPGTVGASPVLVSHVDKYTDRAIAYLTMDFGSYSGFLYVHWVLNVERYYTTTDDGLPGEGWVT